MPSRCGLLCLLGGKQSWSKSGGWIWRRPLWFAIRFLGDVGACVLRACLGWYGLSVCVLAVCVLLLSKTWTSDSDEKLIVTSALTLSVV
jgi:hypothetical protein